MNGIRVSKVLHLSNITHNVSRFDVIDEISKICPVKQVFILRPNSQALVELSSSEDALAVYNKFQDQPLVILGNEVEVNFSRYDQLVKPEDQSTPQCVLLVSIICCDNSTLSLQHFYSICSRFSPVERIRMFIHQAGPQALVQFPNLYDAIRAKGELEKFTYNLNGRRYAFEVQFSKLKELVIHKNNNYSRDFILFPMHFPSKQSNSYDLNFPSNLPRSFIQDSPMEGQNSLPPTSYFHDSPLVDSTSFMSSNDESPRFQQSSLSKDSDFPLSSYSSWTNQNQANSKLFGKVSNRPYFRDFPATFASDLDLFPSGLARVDSSFSHVSSDSPLSSGTEIGSSWSRSNDLLNGSGSLFHVRCNSLCKYVLEGFRRTMPISDLVDFLYGMDIKYAEYKMEYDNSYSVSIIGKSEWTDAMLVNYLNANPVDGSIIRLGGVSVIS